MLRIIMKRESSTKNLLLLATLICGSYGTLEPMTSVAQPLEFKDWARVSKLDSENEYDLIGKISSIAVGQNSELYFANNRSMHIRMYDADGNIFNEAMRPCISLSSFRMVSVLKDAKKSTLFHHFIVQGLGSISVESGPLLTTDHK